MKKLSLVVATYNEELNLPKLYERIVAIDWRALDLEIEFVVVDDHSRDRTPQILRELAARDQPQGFHGGTGVCNGRLRRDSCR